MRKTGGITQKSCELVTYICDIKLSIHTKYNTFTQTCLKNFNYHKSYIIYYIYICVYVLIIISQKFKNTEQL